MFHEPWPRFDSSAPSLYHPVLRGPHSILAIVAIIPARFASTRLPGKPLSLIAGRPMIQWVYERVRLARTVARTIVATDDDRIREAVRAFGGEVVMTSPTHASGTDRLAEVAATLDAELIVNVQGDEPLLDPATIDAVVEALISDEGADMATAAVAVSSTEEMLASDVVKVVTDGRGHALYFSRAPIPYARQTPCDARGAAEAAIAVRTGAAPHRALRLPQGCPHSLCMPCRRPRSSAPSAWSSSGRSTTACAYAWWRSLRKTARPSTPRKISNASETSLRTHLRRKGPRTCPPSTSS